MSGSANIKPAFQAEHMTGTFKRLVTHIDEDVRKVGALGKEVLTRTMRQEIEEFEGGWMVYFPQGHSIFIADDDLEQLQRVGVFDAPPRVDMESGEVVPDNYNLSPKEIVERASQNRPRPFSQAAQAAQAVRHTGGLTDVVAGTDG